MNISSFRSNLLALYAVQALQYLLPLLLLPILTRELGPQQYGRLSYWQSLITGASLIVEFGFNYSAVREASQNHAYPHKLGSIFRSTMVAKLLLFLPSAIILLALPQSVSRESHLNLQALGLLSLLGTALSPAWYLLSIKRNAPLAYASAVTSVLTVLACLVFVKGPESFYMAAGIQFSAPLLASIAMLGYVAYRARPPASRLEFSAVVATFRSGFPLFITSLSAGIYSAFNPFLLGMVSSTTQVAYFSLGERLARSARNALSPIIVTMFPYAASADTNDSTISTALRRTATSTIAIAIISSILLTACAPLIITIVAGTAYSASVLPARILSINVALITIGNMIGVQYLIARGHEAGVFRITVIFAPLHLASFLIAGYAYGATGAAIAYVITEAFVTMAFLLYALRLRGTK